MKKRIIKEKEQDFNPIIPFGKGRPKRKNMINQEDIINLKIALETSEDFDDFISII